MATAEQKIIEENFKENRRVAIHKMLLDTKQYNVSALEIKERKVRVSKNHWVIDFASCNYLGLDLEPEMQEGVIENISKWGVHPSWCRLVASPYLYDEIEKKLADLIGTETTLILPTVTLISIGVIPALVGRSGVLFLDKSSHETLYEGAKIARDSGAILESFEQDDFQKLEELLHKHKNNSRKVILIDGVYSMTGDYVELPQIAQLAKKYDALVYIDDAHGFGVVGEKPSQTMPIGHKGNGIVRYYNMNYDNIVYVGGCSKAYSSLAAFIGCTHEMKAFLQAFATPYDLSGPCPTASLSSLLRGLEINEAKGSIFRDRLWNLTKKAITGLRNLGFKVVNKTGYPIVYVEIGNNPDLIETSNLLFQEGILVTVSPYPMVKKGKEGHRITITAANTEEEIETLLHAFSKVKEFLSTKATVCTT